MKQYRDATELWQDTYVDLLTSHRTAAQSRDGDVAAEAVGYSFVLLDAGRNVTQCPVRKFSPQYASAEVLWMLQGCADTQMILAYSPAYERFLEPDKTTFGGYGVRWVFDHGLTVSLVRAQRTLDGDASSEWTPDSAKKLIGLHVKSQLQAALTLLQQDPLERRCVISMWNGGDLIHAITRDKRDLPCCLSLQFLLRDGRLHSVAYCRSQDTWLGLPNDIFTFTCVTHLLAGVLGVTAGSHTHHVGSIHVYQRHAQHLKSVQRALSTDSRENAWQRGSATQENLAEVVTRALAAEMGARLKKIRPDSESLLAGVMGCEMLHDLVMAAASRWVPETAQDVKSPLLRAAVERELHPDD